MTDSCEPAHRGVGRSPQQAGPVTPGWPWRYAIAALALCVAGCATLGRPVVSQSEQPVSVCADAATTSGPPTPTTTATPTTTEDPGSALVPGLITALPTTTDPSPITTVSFPPQAQAPARINGFNSYSEVQACDFPGPYTFGEATLRFKTAEGVRCEIRDGPHSPTTEFSNRVRCWGPLPGVPAGVSLVTLDTGMIAKYGHVTSDEKTDIAEDLFMDPSKYRELAPGQKLVVPGAKPGEKDQSDAVCAVDQDHSLTCEIQHDPVDDATHGFRLSTAGSTVY